MGKFALTFSMTFLGIAALEQSVFAETPEYTQSMPFVTAPQKPSTPFTAFTGKIQKNKVRMRLQPNLESTIIRELGVEDLVVAIGESDDFYAVEAPTDLKAYIYRSFVLDGIVEGDHVNVRLHPDLTSPIVAQLNSGDVVAGAIYGKDKKWMEISPPHSTRFYIAKEYVQKIGDSNLMATLVKKPVVETKPTKLDGKIEGGLLVQTPAPTAFPNNNNPALTGIPNTITGDLIASQIVTVSTVGSANWTTQEQKLFTSWKEKNLQLSLDDFYREQASHAENLKGLLEPYTRNVKNKPGDYVLVDAESKLPMAYLYSTRVNLQEKVGQQVTIQGATRSNNNFAFPAYYVLTIN